jgi:3-deoxy-7-phosphoheptulonate synthase
MVEVHHAPDKALSDGAQSLYPSQFEGLCRQVQSIFDNLQSDAGKT